MTHDEFKAEVERKRLAALKRIRQLPISILLWGPAPDTGSRIGKTRARLRGELESEGHLVHYSEDLYDPEAGITLLSQQVAHVEAHDITFSLPDSPGSIAEAHDFARIPFVSSKIVTFVDRKYNEGYSNRTLIELASTATCRVQVYDGEALPDCVVNECCDLVRRLQEFYYIVGRRF